MYQVLGYHFTNNLTALIELIWKICYENSLVDNQTKAPLFETFPDFNHRGGGKRAQWTFSI